nr:hypothetical protein [Tanacetum cinerariifolium]
MLCGRRLRVQDSSSYQGKGFERQEKLKLPLQNFGLSLGGIDVASTGRKNGFGADLEFTQEIEFEKDFVLEDLKSFVGSVLKEDSSSSFEFLHQSFDLGRFDKKFLDERLFDVRAVLPGGRVVDEGKAGRQKSVSGQQSTSKWFWVIFPGASARRHGTLPGGTTPVGRNNGLSAGTLLMISSPERLWDIPDVDPYEEAALQAIEQVAPSLSPAYLPDPIKLDEHVPVYVSEPKYLEYLEPPADDIVAEDQPHADDAVPTALSPGYIANSNPEEDPKEDPEEEENADYANEPKEEDPYEEDPKEEDPKEEELRGARMSIRPHTPMPPLFEARVAELLAMPTPPPSPLTLMPSPLPQIPSPPLPIPSPPPIPSSPLPPPVPVKRNAPEQDFTAALLMLPSTTHRSEVPEADMPPQKRLCFATPIIGFEVGESLAAAATRPPGDLYGFVDTTEAKESITRSHSRTIHDIERRMMTAVKLVNLRVSYEAHTHQRDGEEFHL